MEGYELEKVEEKIWIPKEIHEFFSDKEMGKVFGSFETMIQDDMENTLDFMEGVVIAEKYENYEDDKSTIKRILIEDALLKQLISRNRRDFNDGNGFEKASLQRKFKRQKQS